MKHLLSSTSRTEMTVSHKIPLDVTNRHKTLGTLFSPRIALIMLKFRKFCSHVFTNKDGITGVIRMQGQTQYVALCPPNICSYTSSSSINIQLV